MNSADFALARMPQRFLGFLLLGFMALNACDEAGLKNFLPPDKENAQSPAPDHEEELPSDVNEANEQSKPRFQIRMLSYNVWGLYGIAGGKAQWRYAEIGKRLKSYHLVALQEMWDKKTNAIIENAQFAYVIRAEKIHQLLGGTGLALLSRYPAIETHTLYYRRCASSDCLAHKAALYVRLRLPDGSLLDVYNTHLNAWFKIGDRDIGAEVRDSQLNELSSWIAQLSQNVPYLILGDLNADENSDNYRSMSDRFWAVDLMRETLPNQPLITYDPDRNNWISGVGKRVAGSQRLDYIWLGGGILGKNDWQVQATGLVMDEPHLVTAEQDKKEAGKLRMLSDHFGVFAQAAIY